MRHSVKACLYLVIGAMIGSVPTQIWSQEDVSPQAENRVFEPGEFKREHRYVARYWGSANHSANHSVRQK